MASIGKDPGRLRRILFVAPDGKRKTIRLGKATQRTAEGVTVKVEALVSAQFSGQSPDDETSRWVAGLDSMMADKLTAVGLIAKQASTSKTIGDFLPEYIDGRQDVKPDTKVVWRHVHNDLLDFFGASRALKTVTEADADALKQCLLQKGLAMATVAKRLQVCRMMFKGAVRAKYIPDNPFREVVLNRLEMENLGRMG